MRGEDIDEVVVTRILDGDSTVPARKGAGVTILPPTADTQHLDAQTCPVCSATPRETPTVVASKDHRVAHYTCESGHAYSVWWHV